MDKPNAADDSMLIVHDGDTQSSTKAIATMTMLEDDAKKPAAKPSVNQDRFAMGDETNTNAVTLVKLSAAVQQSATNPNIPTRSTRQEESKDPSNLLKNVPEGETKMVNSKAFVEKGEEEAKQTHILRDGEPAAAAAASTNPESVAVAARVALPESPTVTVANTRPESTARVARTFTKTITPAALKQYEYHFDRYASLLLQELSSVDVLPHLMPKNSQELGGGLWVLLKEVLKKENLTLIQQKFKAVGGLKTMFRICLTKLQSDRANVKSAHAFHVLIARNITKFAALYNGYKNLSKTRPAPVLEILLEPLLEAVQTAMSAARHHQAQARIHHKTNFLVEEILQTTCFHARIQNGTITSAAVQKKAMWRFRVLHGLGTRAVLPRSKLFELVMNLVRQAPDTTTTRTALAAVDYFLSHAEL